MFRSVIAAENMLLDLAAASSLRQLLSLYVQQRNAAALLTAFALSGDEDTLYQVRWFL
jgi:hypothetical protein